MPCSSTLIDRSDPISQRAIPEIAMAFLFVFVNGDVIANVAINDEDCAMIVELLAEIHEANTDDEDGNTCAVTTPFNITCNDAELLVYQNCKR